MAGDSVFEIGKRFYSYEELEKAKTEFEATYFVNFSVRDAKTLECMRKHAPKRTQPAKQDLRYYVLRLCCIFGGRPFRKKGDNKRLTETRKVGCKAFVRLKLCADGQSLEVVDADLSHSNHVVTKEVYDHLPMQRRLNDVEKGQAESMLSVRANAKLVQQHLQNMSGKVVLLKDLANISFFDIMLWISHSLRRFIYELYILNCLTRC